MISPKVKADIAEESMERCDRDLIGDFIILFNASWYKNFPIAAGFAQIGKPAVWTHHIAACVKDCADFMGYFTSFQFGRFDAVIETASRKNWAILEWEWREPCSPDVNELKKLTAPAVSVTEDAELFVYIGYSRESHHAKNIKVINAAWKNIDKPLLAFLITYHFESDPRDFKVLQTHRFRAGTHEFVRQQCALPWEVEDTVWNLIAQKSESD